MTRMSQIFTAMMLAGCLQAENDSRCPEAECGPFEYRDTYFPLAQGNSWEFEETVNGESIGQVRLTVSEWHPDSVNGGATSRRIWWTFKPVIPEGNTSSSLNQMYGRYLFSGDTTYVGWTESGHDLSAPEFVLPPGADTLHYFVFLGGDVPISMKAVRLPGPYIVPAGNFADCIAYHYEAHAVTRTVLCPRVGRVAVDFQTRASGAQLRLTGYTLKK